MASTGAHGLMIEDTGDGVPVVMVHGLGGTSNTFQPQMRVLANHRVVRPDLPGSGRSPAPVEELSVAYFADAVAAALKPLEIRRAHFVGHSLGTLVCQRIAADKPDLVASLVLFGALTEPPDQARRAFIDRAAKARADGMAGIADQVATNTLATAAQAEKPECVAFVRESLMRQSPEGYARTCEALAHAEAVDPRRIKALTLLITGDEDQSAPVSMARQLADGIGGASLIVLERCGHWATIEKATDSNRRLAEFLQRSTV